jgi:hypothetical protein
LVVTRWKGCCMFLHRRQMIRFLLQGKCGCFVCHLLSITHCLWHRLYVAVMGYLIYLATTLPAMDWELKR